MAVKDRPEVFEALDRAEAALREATSDVERTKVILEMVREKPGITVAELASQFLRRPLSRSCRRWVSFSEQTVA